MFRWFLLIMNTKKSNKEMLTNNNVNNNINLCIIYE